MFSVLVIRLRSLRLLRVSGIVMRLRMFLLLITFLKASHSFRNRLLVICKNAYLFATMIMTSVSSPFSCMFGAIAGGIASALAGGAMSKLFGGGQKAASGGIQGDVLATDNNTVGMGDAGIKSAIQGSNVPNPD